MDLRLRRTLITGSATFGVWDRQYFLNVTDYDTWEEELLDDEDIVRHITAGHFVPITIYSDGAFEFEVRVGEPEINSLSPREHQFLIESSEPYLFRSAGELSVSGIEFVGEERDDQIATLQIPAGDYDVTVHYIDWEKEPGAQDEQGQASADALPDFVVLVNENGGTLENYRKVTRTFESIT